LEKEIRFLQEIGFVKIHRAGTKRPLQSNVFDFLAIFHDAPTFHLLEKEIRFLQEIGFVKITATYLIFLQFAMTRQHFIFWKKKSDFFKKSDF
jgi:hypothetical protein